MSKTLFAVSKGFSIVEIVLASSILGLISLAGVGVFIYAQENAMLSGNRHQALFLAEEGLEAARNMRDGSFENLAAGIHGLSYSGSNWAFSGTSDTQGLFTRQIQVVDLDANRKQVTSTVTWQQNAQRDGLVSLTTHLNHWDEIVVQGGEAESLKIDTSNVGIDPRNNGRVVGIYLNNNAEQDITLASMTINWSGISEAKGNTIIINGNEVWSGSSDSGDEHDLADVVLLPSQGPIPINFIQFNKNITGIVMDIIFTMADGSTQVINNIIP